MKTYFSFFLMLLMTLVYSQTIQPGYTFPTEKKIYSSNKQYYLVFQNDGNLVMYNRKNAPVWRSNTDSKGAKAIFQNDGNLVVYNRAGAPVFSTNTDGKARVLKIQDDGSLVLYGMRNAAVWASRDDGNIPNNINTGIIYKDHKFSKKAKFYSANGEFYLMFQQDGNMVVYSKDHVPYWDSNTQGRGEKAIFQSDGNLVIYDIAGKAIFSTNTAQYKVDRLVIQNDGNLVIYDYNDNPLWAAK